MASSTKLTLAPSTKYPTVKIVARPSHERGHADHGWLKTFHTFNFASYSDQFDSFGALRVINEDRVAPSRGFGSHSHREFEIFSYVVSGELEHKDSMGNREILKRGDLQMTSTGTGITHSEYNASKSKPVHFIQIWASPSQSRLPPTYYTRHFTDAQKTNTLLPIVAPLHTSSSSSSNESPSVSAELIPSLEREAPGPAPIHSTLTLYATLLQPSKTVLHEIPSSSTLSSPRKAYVHVIQTSGYNTKVSKSKEEGGARIRLNGGLEIGEGDGAFVMSSGKTGAGKEALEIENVGSKDAEVLVFDIE